MIRMAKGETKRDFINRCMADNDLTTDFPDLNERNAVAHAMLKNSIGNYGAEHPWPKKYTCTFIEPGVVAYQDLGPCEVCGDAKTCIQEGRGSTEPGSGCQPVGETVLVRQECLAKMAKSFEGKPVIDKEHKDVVASTVADGDADGVVTRVWLDDKSGWWMCEFYVWTPEAQKHCETKGWSVSCAYEPTDVNMDGGEYHNIAYQEEIMDGVYTHLALVTSPRYEAARIFANSKVAGGKKMAVRTWWDKMTGRKNALPLDLKEKINVDGKEVEMKDLLDSLEHEKPKFNDDSVFETAHGEKSLADLKNAYRAKMKNAAPASELPGQPPKDPAAGAAPADAGGKEHQEGKENAEPKKDEMCPNCNGSGKMNSDKPVVEKPLPDPRDPKAENADDAAASARAKEEERQNVEATAKAEAEAKATMEKNAHAQEMQAAAEKEAAAVLERQNAGRAAFRALENARASADGVVGEIVPEDMSDRLKRGKDRYGKSA